MNGKILIVNFCLMHSYPWDIKRVFYTLYLWADPDCLSCTDHLIVWATKNVSEDTLIVNNSETVV